MCDITVADIARLIFEARTDPNNERVVAMRLALEEIDRQAQERRDHIAVKQDLAGATDWRRIANNHVEHDELERRRAEPAYPRPPTPDPELTARFDEDERRREAWRAENDERPDDADQLAAS